MFNRKSAAAVLTPVPGPIPYNIREKIVFVFFSIHICIILMNVLSVYKCIVNDPSTRIHNVFKIEPFQ